MIEMILQYSETWQFSLSFLFLQIAVVVVVAGLLNRLLKSNPQQRHFVWVASLIAAVLIVPLQWSLPAWQIEVAQEAVGSSVENSFAHSNEAGFDVDVDASANQPERANESAFLPKVLGQHGMVKTHTDPAVAISGDSHSAGVSHSGRSLRDDNAEAAIFSLAKVSEVSLLTWLWVTYLVVVGMWSLRLFFAWRRLAAIRTSEEISLDVLGIADEVAAKIGLNYSPDLLLSAKIHTPMAIGVWRPRVVLPTAFTNWSTDCQRIVLAHEISHIARRDALNDLLAQLIGIVYWFHPAIHLAKRALRQNRELATDQAVLTMGFAPVDYARELLNIASGQTDQPRGYVRKVRAPMVGVPMAGEQDLTQRIKQVLQFDRCANQRRANRLLQTSVVLTLLALAGFSIQITSVAAPPAPPKTVSTSTTQEEQKQKPELKTYEHVQGDNFYSRVVQVEPAKTDSQMEGIEISGVVIDRSDKPVANEIVIVRNAMAMSASRGRKINDVIQKTRTDEQGKFSFESVHIADPYKRVQIFVITEAGEMAWSKSIRNSTAAAFAQSMKLKLEPSTEYEGTVVDSGGVPVTGAELKVAFFRRLRKGGRGMEYVSLGDRAISPTVVTDSQGKFRFPALPKEIAIGLEVQHPKFPKSYVYVSGSAAEAAKNWAYETKTKIYSSNSKIVLQPGVELKGKVVDQDGNPITDAYCDVNGQEAEPTGLDGAFRLLLNQEWLNHPKSTHKFRLTSRHKDFGYVVNEFSREELLKSDLQITLLPPAEITGRVIDDVGQPVSRVDVTVSSSNGIIRTARTDTDGGFKVQTVQGDIQVKISGSIPGYDLKADDREIDIYKDEVNFREYEVKAGETRVVETFVVKRTDGILVTVVDDNGQPVTGAEVSLLSNSGGSRHAPNGKSQKTAMDGSCNLMPAIKPTPSSIVSARWSNDGQHFWGQRLINTEDHSAEVTLHPAALASGRVTLNGEPLADVLLRLTVNVPSNLIEGLHPQQSVSFAVGDVKTDSSGEYIVVVPSRNVIGDPAKILVGVRDGVPNSRASQISSYMKFDGVGYIYDIDFVKGDQHISGRVVDPEGKPISSLTVTIGRTLRGQNKVNPHRLYQPSTVYTDVDGRFKIEGLLPNQTYQVRAGFYNRAQTQRYETENLQVESGEENLEFTVSRWEEK